MRQSSHPIKFTCFSHWPKFLSLWIFYACATWHPDVAQGPYKEFEISPREMAKRDDQPFKLLAINLIMKSCQNAEAENCVYFRSREHEELLGSVLKKLWPVNEVSFFWPFPAENLELSYWSEAGEMSILDYNLKPWLVDGLYKVVWTVPKEVSSLGAKLAHYLTLSLYPLSSTQSFDMEWTPLMDHSWPFQRKRRFEWKERVLTGPLLWFAPAQNWQLTNMIEIMFFRPEEKSN